MRFLLFACIAAVILTAQTKSGKAPAAVLEAFQKDYPSAKIKAVKKESKDGKTVYEVESSDGAISRDLLYSADGKVIETEEGIPPQSLPPAITASIAAKYPKSEISSAEKVTTPAGTKYEVIIKAQGKKKELTLDASGKLQ